MDNFGSLVVSKANLTANAHVSYKFPLYSNSYINKYYLIFQLNSIIQYFISLTTKSTKRCQHFLPLTMLNWVKSKFSVENRLLKTLTICDAIRSPPLPWNSGAAFAELKIEKSILKKKNLNSILNSSNISKKSYQSTKKSNLPMFGEQMSGESISAFIVAITFVSPLI
jgi:hypothetical protein